MEDRSGYHSGEDAAARSDATTVTTDAENLNTDAGKTEIMPAFRSSRAGQVLDD